MKIFAKRSLSSIEMLGAEAASDFEKRRPVGVICTADSEVEGLRRVPRSPTSTSSTVPIFTCFSELGIAPGTARLPPRLFRLLLRPPTSTVSGGCRWKASSSQSSGIDASAPLLNLRLGESWLALDVDDARDEQVEGRRSGNANKSTLGGGSTSISGGGGL